MLRRERARVAGPWRSRRHVGTTVSGSCARRAWRTWSSGSGRGSRASLEMTILPVPVPDSLVDRLGGQERAARRFLEAAVLELLRAGELTSGEAAEVLGIPRRAVLELMARHDIPIAN